MINTFKLSLANEQSYFPVRPGRSERSERRVSPNKKGKDTNIVGKRQRKATGPKNWRSILAD